MISVVIPAHNEAAVLSRCLRALTEDAQPGELEVIVVANGCTDDTEKIAAVFGPPVRLIRVDEPSKPAALNAGDREATGFPRFYVDADVMLGTAAVRRVSAALGDSQLAAGPGLLVDTTDSSLLVRSYYRIWSRLPSVRNDLVGRGVYAVSEIGRRRFGPFPNVINDDHFFRERFAPTERVVVDGCYSQVWAPRSLSALVKRKTRVHIGHQAQRRQVPPWEGVSAVVRSEPRRIVDLPAFALVGLMARIRTRQLRRGGGTLDWGRDDSRG